MKDDRQGSRLAGTGAPKTLRRVVVAVTDAIYLSLRSQLAPAAITFFALLGRPAESGAQSAYVRVNQIGYEAGNQPFRAYLMSTALESGATFSVTNSQGNVVYSAAVGALFGTWSHSKTLTYDVYVIDFAAPRGNTYTISVSGPAAATSPSFPVGTRGELYPGLLLNTLFFYETERDGPNYIPNALRTVPGHLNDVLLAVGGTRATT